MIYQLYFLCNENRNQQELRTNGKGPLERMDLIIFYLNGRKIRGTPQ